jgi:chromosome partitioning protein
VRTIAIVNQKGGCGKTTTAINLAAVFARDGRRTLLVDMDPQSHCAAGLGVPEKRVDFSIADALVEDNLDRVDPGRLVWEVARNLDLAPATMRLAALEAPGGGLHDLPEKDRRLERVLRRFVGLYDVCLIDCPPTIGLLTFNALRGAREALIPVETGYFALKGAQKQWETIQRVIRHIGRPIACHIVPTLHDPESELAQDILVALRRHFAGQIVPLVIREHAELREAVSMGQPVSEYAPESEAARDYDALADWLHEHEARPCVDIEIIRRDEPGPAPGAPFPEPVPETVAAAVGTEPTGGPPELARSNRPVPVPVPVPAPSAATPSTRGDRAGEVVKRLRSQSPGTADTAQAMQQEIREAIAGAPASTDCSLRSRSVAPE